MYQRMYKGGKRQLGRQLRAHTPFPTPPTTTLIWEFLNAGKLTL